jgi:hypothetical protein
VAALSKTSLSKINELTEGKDREPEKMTDLKQARSKLGRIKLKSRVLVDSPKKP